MPAITPARLWVLTTALFSGTGCDSSRLTFDMTGLSNTRGVLPDTLRVSGTIALGASVR